MDGPDHKGVSSSKPIKPSEIARFSVSDENDTSHHQMGHNLQTPNKPTQKHYMSPTISASSKATIPKKKILTERNEASESIFSDSHSQNTPILESKLTFANPGTDNEGNTLVANDSLRSPYDPLTNYLTPRPKFLRYKPNRRREIFLRQENEIGEGNEGLSISTSSSYDSQKANDEESDSVSGRGSLDSSSEEGWLKQKDEEIEESDEENEEVEEERGWGLKRVLESLFWFVLLVLSTSYISSMNSRTPSTDLQSFEGLEDVHCKIQNHSLETFLAKKLESGSDIWSQREEIQMGLDQGNQKDIGERIEEEEMVEDDVKMGEVELSEELNEVVEQRVGESEAVEVVEDEMKGEVDELGEEVEPKDEGIEDNCDHETEKIKDVFDQMVENSELQSVETVEKLEDFQDHQAPFMSDGVDHHSVESDDSNLLEEENEMELVEEVYNQKAGDDSESDRERVEDITNKVGEIIRSERKLVERLMEYLENEALVKALIGVSVSMIVASLVLGFYFKRKKNMGKKNSSVVTKPRSESLMVEQKKTITKDSSLVIKPCSESVMAEKCSSVLLNREENHVEHVDSSKAKHIEHVDSFKAKHIEKLPNPSSFLSKVEVSKDYFESQAPSVELLGELEVGEVSSSLRSCGMKNRRIETEESNYSVSIERKLGSKAHSVSVQSCLDSQEFSTMDSHSYGRYTAEKNILKKEEDKDEVKVTTTPVRRSSRIRNRSVMSP